MTKDYNDEMDDMWNYHYEYFDAYFTLQNQSKQHNSYIDKLLVEFAMINPYSYINVLAHM